MNQKYLLIPFIGAFVSVLLVNYVSKFAPKNPIPTTDPSESRYGKSIHIRVASAFVIVAWLSIIGTLMAMCLGLMDLISLNIFIYWVISLLISGSCYVAICPFLKCESCGRRVTVQWTRESPPFAEKMWGMNGWASTILHVMLSRKFTCMYCGKHYSVT